MSSKLEIALEVDDKGTVVVKKFTQQAGKSLDDMANKGTGATDKLKNAFTKISGAALTLTKKVGEVTLKIAALGVKIVALGVAAAGTAAAFTMKAAIEQFASFESALVDMGKVTTESFESIKAKVMELPPQLGSATELVRGYYQVISAGVKDPKAALETLTISAKTAKAAHVDQSEVIKGLTKVMAGYEGKIKTVSEAADLLFTIEKEGQTAVAELIPVIGGLAKISHDLGISQNELGAAFAQVTQTAGSTEQAATQYRGVLVALMKPTKDMGEAIHEMGYESAQAMIKEMGLTETLRMLMKATGGSQEKMAAMFSSVEAIQGVSALAANEFKNLAEKTKVMGDKAGAGAKAWKDYTGTLKAMWETFKSAIGKQAILIGEKLAPQIKKVLEATTTWAEKNRDLIAQEVGDWVKGIVEVAKELWPKVKAVAEWMGDWYETNKKIIGTKLVSFLSGVAKHVDLIIPTMQTFLQVVKGIASAFQAIGKAIGWAMHKLVEFYNKTKDMGPLDVVTEFLGKGSSIKVLGEKLTEMEGGIKNFERTVSTTTPALTIDMTGLVPQELPATEAFQTVEDVAVGAAETIDSLEPSFKVDAAPAMVALEKLRNEAGSTLAALLETYAVAYGNAFNLPGGEGIMHALEVENIMTSRIAQERERLGRITRRSELLAQTTTLSYQAGTGVEGLPRTGWFYGHQGEIVKNPAESASERRGEAGGGNTYHVTISPAVMTGDRASMREVAGAFQEALKELDHRWN